MLESESVVSESKVTQVSKIICFRTSSDDLKVEIYGVSYEWI